MARGEQGQPQPAQRPEPTETRPEAHHLDMRPPRSLGHAGPPGGMGDVMTLESVLPGPRG